LPGAIIRDADIVDDAEHEGDPGRVRTCDALHRKLQEWRAMIEPVRRDMPIGTP